MEDIRLDMRTAVTLLGLNVDTNKSQARIPCPFCGNGNRASKNFSINFDLNSLGSFHCFACEAKGDPVEFWRLMRNLNDYNEAVKDYRNQIGSDSLQAELKKSQARKFEKKDVDVADIQSRHETYSALLNLLPLSETHKNNLLSRGLSEEEIEQNQYKSVPTSRLDSIARELAKKGLTLKGVPGFYINDEGKWQLKYCSSGFFIPQRNGYGQIQGMQIRLDNIESGGPRYISLSSRDKNQGSPAYTYCHMHKGSNGLSEVILTEGALKADIISSYTGYSVISIPGVNSQSHLTTALVGLKRKGLRKICIAFDADIKTNSHVEAARQRLIETLQNLSIPYSLLEDWDDNYKGLDDWLHHYKSK